MRACSADGAEIAYERAGDGPLVVLVGGDRAPSGWSCPTRATSQRPDVLGPALARFFG